MESTVKKANNSIVGHKRKSPESSKVNAPASSKLINKLTNENKRLKKVMAIMQARINDLNKCLSDQDKLLETASVLINDYQAKIERDACKDNSKDMLVADDSPEKKDLHECVLEGIDFAESSVTMNLFGASNSLINSSSNSLDSSSNRS